MKACIVIQNQYSKLGHALALTLKKKYGVTEWCTYVISPGAADFIRAQTDIRYDPVLVDHELHAKYPNEVIDHDYIAQFEKTYGPPYPWQYLYADRKLMMSIGPKEETTTLIDPLYGHDDLTKIFQVRAKAIEKMLTEAKPDFILFFAIGTLGHLILYHVAKKLGIKTYNIDFPRLQNRICISEDYRTLTAVENTAKHFAAADAKTPYHDDAQKMIAKFRSNGSLDLQYMDIALGALPKAKKIFSPHHFFDFIRYLVILTKNYLRNRTVFVYGNTDQNPLRFVGQKCKQWYRAIRGQNQLYGPVDWNEKFVYIPLHYEPELAILTLSPFYFDQIDVVKYIARSVPLDYKVYVKEHPAMVSKRKRSFYTSLQKLPNIVLIDHRIKGFELIKHTKLVATITGTAGWEASLYGKPVITFGEVFYNALSGVKRVRVLDELPELVRQQLFDFQYDEQEMEHFAAAVLQESIPFDFSRLWYENDIATLECDPGLNQFCALLMRYVHGETNQSQSV